MEKEKAIKVQDMTVVEMLAHSAFAQALCATFEEREKVIKQYKKYGAKCKSQPIDELVEMGLTDTGEFNAHFMQCQAKVSTLPRRLRETIQIIGWTCYKQAAIQIYMNQEQVSIEDATSWFDSLMAE